MGLLLREHPKAQPKGGFGFTPLIELFGIYKMFKISF